LAFKLKCAGCKLKCSWARRGGSAITTATEIDEEFLPEVAINDAIAVERRHAHRSRATKLRALIQLARLLTSSVFWASGVSRGDGHSVLVIPGYAAADLHYIPMRSWLRRLGYRPLRSGMSFNAGWSWEIVTELGRRVEDEYRERGRTSHAHRAQPGWTSGTLSCAAVANGG
jgi:hypothetical protein